SLTAVPNFTAGVTGAQQGAALAQSMLRAAYWSKVKTVSIVAASVAAVALVIVPLLLSPGVHPFVPTASSDIGLPRTPTNFSYASAPKVPGTFDLSAETLTILSSGLDCWGHNDSCTFVYQAIRGNSTLTVRIADVEDTGKHPKSGIMVRASLRPDAI